MRLNLRSMIVALAGVLLFASGPPVASQIQSIAAPGKDKVSTHFSRRASTLLVEIQREIVGLRHHADTLRAISRNYQHSWQSYAFSLEGVKGHINAVGERTAELQQIQHAVPPRQQQAITEVTTHAVQVAASTEAAIDQLNENRNSVYRPEYRDHLVTIADHSENMQQVVDKFFAYEKTQQQIQRLQRELESSGG